MSTLMEWKKHKVLGSGSYGTVYLATPVNDYSFMSSSLAAVKSAAVPYSYSLRKEAEFLNALRGKPNIIRCFGEDTSLEKDGRVYNLFLEYASGGSLHDLIKNNRGTIPESVVARYTLMLLRGIAAIHESDFVHCDLKPANILVFPSGGRGNLIKNQLKIADFGLAKKLWERDEVARDGVCRGTAMYASPESINCGLNEKPADIWSLGCIIFEMITGQRIWSFKDVQDVLLMAMYGNPIANKIPQNLSEECKDFLKKCLTRNPNDRWTAKRLMDHPFITKNITFWQYENYQAAAACFSTDQTNPFGRWTSKVNLFAKSSVVDEASKANPCLFYSLFPENKAHPFLFGF